jgi:DNA-binding transcriptional LysR family regulator
MNFRKLEAFRHVILTGTTKEAARRLFVSQPAISRLINALEEEVGFTLFNRIKGRLQPTTAGLRFYEAVEQNFMGLERLDQTAARIRHSEPRELKIACTPALSATLLPLAIKAYRVHYPTIMINVDTVIVPDLLDRIQQMRVDLAVTLAFPPITGIEVETLLETENYCAMATSHPLASKDVITPQDLVGFQLLKPLPTGPLTWEEEEQIFQNAGIEPKYVTAYHTSHTGYAMIAQNLCIGLMEPFAAQHWRKEVTLRRFRPRVQLTYALAYPSPQIQSKPIYDFCEAVRETFKNWTFPSR